MYADFNIIDRNTIRVAVYKGEGPRIIGRLECHTHHASEIFCDIGQAYIWLSKQGVQPQKVTFTWGKE